MKEYNGYPNFVTWACYDELLSGLELDDILGDPEICMEDCHNDKDALISEVADTLEEIVRDTMAFGCNYRTSSDIFVWAMRALDEVDYHFLATNLVDEWF